jgi:hypothetical protein
MSEKEYIELNRLLTNLGFKITLNLKFNNVKDLQIVKTFTHAVNYEYFYKQSNKVEKKIKQK